MSVTVTVNGQAGPSLTATSGDTIEITLSPTGTPGGVGPQGPAGATGPANTLTIGTVSGGATAAATITGTAPNQTLNLTLPAGAKGDKGDTGSTGATGPAGPANTLSIGTVTSGTAAATITGTAPTQVLNLTLPTGAKGDTGATGPAGPANTLTVGTVNSGSSPSATITGTAPNQVLNLVLARGETGLQGATGATGPANTLSIGTVTEGSSAGASITGTAPAQTLNLTIPTPSLSIGTVSSGSSAAATITGSSPSYTLNLTLPKGDKGDTGSTGAAGATGAAGPANTLSIGTVTSGETAAATITGTAPTQTLNLTLPKGDKGDTGATGAAGPSYTLPEASASVLGGVKVGTGLAISGGVLSATGGGGSFSWASVPASSNASGTAGDIAYDANYLYVRNATNWKRVLLSTFGADNYFSSVQLLLHMNGTNGSTTFTDSSSAARTVTANGDASISTAQSKWGGASAYFDGTGDYLSLGDAAALELGSSDYAIEMWIRTTTTSQYATLIGRMDGVFASGMWTLMLNLNSTGDVALFVANYSTGSPLLSSTGVNVSDGTWHHVAVSRSGSSHSLYVDGTRVGTATSSYTVADIGNGINIGRDSYYGRNYRGYIDDLRLTIGSDRGYTGTTITVPTEAFPDA